MSSPLSDKAKAFLARKPTLIGTVAGIRFYEHPTRGDEAPLLTINSAGKLHVSDWFELPLADEL